MYGWKILRVVHGPERPRELVAGPSFSAEAHLCSCNTEKSSRTRGSTETQSLGSLPFSLFFWFQHETVTRKESCITPGFPPGHRALCHHPWAGTKPRLFGGGTWIPREFLPLDLAVAPPLPPTLAAPRKRGGNPRSEVLPGALPGQHLHNSLADAHSL